MSCSCRKLRLRTGDWCGPRLPLHQKKPLAGHGGQTELLGGWGCTHRVIFLCGSACAPALLSASSTSYQLGKAWQVGLEARSELSQLSSVGHQALAASPGPRRYLL